MDEVIKSINLKKISDGCNKITIVLIPKVPNPDHISQFRAISMCNVVYKVITKLIAASLHDIVSQIKVPLCLID